MITSKTKHRNSPEYENLMQIFCGHVAFQICAAGSELGLFDLLAKTPNLSKSEIQKQLSLEHRPTRILLTGLVSLRMISNSQGRYANLPLTTEFMVKATPGNWVDVLGWQKYIVYPGLMDFATSLKENKNTGLDQFPGDEPELYSRLRHNKKLEVIFQDAMSALSKSANQILVEKVDFSKYNHIVDIGGGDGTNAIKIAKNLPNIKITVFDNPSVCSMAEDNIRENGLEARISALPGDIFTTPLPSGIDAVLLSHMLTIWSPENNIRILRKIYDHLPKHGDVVVFNTMGYEDESGPMITALGSPYFLAIATGEGMLYS